MKSVIYKALQNQSVKKKKKSQIWFEEFYTEIKND